MNLLQRIKGLLEKRFAEDSDSYKQSIDDRQLANILMFTQF